MEKTMQKKKPFNWQLMLMAVPGFLFLLLFFYLPMFGQVSAFQDFNIIKGYFGSEFIGLKNFEILFSSDTIFTAIRNTLAISLLKLVFTFPLAIIFAIMLNELTIKKVKNSVQTISYLPHFVSWVIVIGIWRELLAVEGGLINGILGIFGAEPINFLITKELMWFLTILTEIWKEMGWSAIVYIAALSAIDPGLYEAASIDGAGRWRKIWHVTLPGIKPTIVMMLILAIPNLFNGNLDQMYALTTPAVREMTEIIDTYVLRIGMGEGQYGIGAAAGVAKGVVSVILLFIVNSTAKKLGEDGLF